MDFNSTSLPFEKDVFEAALAFARTKPTETAENHAVLVAQLLSQATDGEPSIIALAFLGSIPEVAYGAMERRFGKNLMDTAREVNLHQRTGFAYIEDASATVKVVAAAHAVANIMEFDAAFDSVLKTVRAFRAMGSTARPDVSVPDAPNMKLLDSVAKNRSGLGSLDWLLVEKLEAFRGSIDEKLKFLGKAPRQKLDLSVFTEHEMAGIPKIKNAFDAIANDPRVAPRDLQLALGAAMLLYSQPTTKNPTVIAAALVDIALPARTADDLNFLEKRVDWDVMELLQRKSAEIGSTRELAKAPVEFRTVAIAYTIAMLHDALREGQGTFEMLEKDGQPSAAAAFLKQTTLNGMSSRAKKAEIVKPVANTVDAPVLERLLEQKLREVQSFVAANTPKPVLMLPAPKTEPKPKATGGFDL